MIPENLRKYDYRGNLIVDENNPILIQKAWRDRFSRKSHWDAGYGGEAYISKPNSEDALTWNVFRTLQLSGKKGLKIVSSLFKISEVNTMLFWGCDVENRGEEQQLLNILIRTVDGKCQGTMTEPDLVVISDKEVVFVECKLNQSGKTSPWKAGKGAEKRFKIYAREFPELKDIANWKRVYQLIRQYVFAKLMAKHLEKRALVVPLINKAHEKILLPYYLEVKNSAINSEGVFYDFITWQDVAKMLLKFDHPDKEAILMKIQEALKHAR